MIIYQTLPRLHGNRNETRKENGTIEENGSGKLNHYTTEELRKIRQLGVSHVWYTGVIRHATKTDYTAYGIPKNHPDIVKGNAGSPYAITDYYDIDPDLAEDIPNRMKEFEALVKRTHRAGMKVITDFVPNHVAREYHSLMSNEQLGMSNNGVVDLGADDNVEHGFDPQNNFYYCKAPLCPPLRGDDPYVENPAKATGNDHFDPWPGVNDWYETVKLNYGVDYYAGGIGYFDPIPKTWHRMLDIVMFWAGKGIDGVRCDMAEMVPTAFWRWMTAQVKAEYPEFIFIGEVYNPSLYREFIASGFDYLYDKVGMYDTMKAVTRHECPASAITWQWQSVDDIRQHMLYFLENHDEQRLASDFFAGCGRKGIPALVASALMERNPFMVYAAQEYGEHGMDQEGFSGRDGRTTIFDYWSIDTLCRADNGSLTAEELHLYNIYSKVLNIKKSSKAAAEGLSYDLMYANNEQLAMSNEQFGFNPERQYAFLRRAEGELLIVVVNFDDREVAVSVNIPQHAFEYLSLPEKSCRATDLLTNDNQQITLSPQKPVAMTVPQYAARIWRLRV